MRYDNNYGLFRWRHLPMPAFDVNRQNGDLYVACADKDSSTSKFRMKFTRSTDAGMTWSTQVRLDAASTPDTFSAIFPWIEVTPGVPPAGGHVYVIWISTKGGNSRIGCFGRVSTDRGVTFLPEEQISDTLVRPDTLPNSSYFAQIIGDYIGCRATSTYIAAAWCDNRNQARVPTGREDVYTSKRIHPSGVEEGRPVSSGRIPVSVELLPAQPNPARGEVSFRFGLPAELPVKLQVYDLSGRLVQTLVSGNQPSGYHTVRWDSRDASGRPLSTGVYLLRLQAGSYSALKQVVLLR
jgi:hypothetical protein